MDRGSVSGMGFSIVSFDAGIAEAPVDASDLRGASRCSEPLASFLRLGSRLFRFVRPFGPALSIVRCGLNLLGLGSLDSDSKLKHEGEKSLYWPATHELASVKSRD